MSKLYFFKTGALTSLILLGLMFSTHLQGQNKKEARTTESEVLNKVKWAVNALDHKLFIANKGQFDKEITTDKVLFEASIGKAKAYFTNKGIIYRYDEFTNQTARSYDKVITHYASVLWGNSNTNVTVEAEGKQNNYYAYSGENNEPIKAPVYKKIIYKNLYPGIDVEYTFPKDREGIKYNIIVHPGADLAQVKLDYKGSKKGIVDNDGNAIVTTAIGDITDHAPVSYYSDGGSVKVSYKWNGAEESFVTAGYNKANTLVIDPWTTTPIFSGSYDKAYDVDYDNNGNVYAYGGYNPFELVKLNSATGAIMWTYQAASIDGVIYGDFVVDKTTGTSYIVEGARATGAKILKVNTNSTLTNTFTGDTNMLEMWRVVMNPCNHNLIIGAGDNNHIKQACTIDTSFTKLNTFNVLGASAAGHTMVFTALDPSGDTCYMATAKSAAIDTANFKNVLVKMPLPSLAPATYIVPDNYKFSELGSINYVGAGIGTANGMNGLSVSPNWVFASDGATLQKINKVTGAAANSVSISGTSFAWGGIATDMCDNVLVGAQNNVIAYNSNLSLLGSIAMPGTVYDIAIGPFEKTIYASGNGFVASINKGVTITAATVTTPAECGCNGTAKITLSACGTIDTSGFSYVWSNGATTRNVSGLCAGQYTVTILKGCVPLLIDTVNISSHFINVNSTSNSMCAGSKGVTMTASGGNNYTWRPATGLSVSTGNIVTAAPAATTTYTLAGNNGSGCNDSVTITITVTPIPTVTVSGPAIPVCPNTAVNLSASGATTYQWSPLSGLSCGTCASTTSTLNFSGNVTYTVVGKTNGCADTAKITYQLYTVPSVSVTTIPTSCDSFNGKATATVTGSEPYTYSWSPKGGTNLTASGLAAGTYTISVYDTNGCKTNATGIVAVTSSPTVTVTSPIATCDSTNATATATINGGTAPFQYVWQPGGNTNSTDAHIGAGIYTVTVIDKNGCKDSTRAIVEDTGMVAPVAKVSNVSCFGGNNGSAAVTIVSGGTGPFTYSWSPSGGSLATENNLAVGQSTVTVTDSKNCKVIDTITIGQPPKLVASIGAINVLATLCYGDSTGAMSVAVGGGVGPYTYSWSTTPAQTNDTAIGLPAGHYTVTVKDANNCVATATDSVKQPAKVVATAGSSPATCGNNGSVYVVVTGGTPGYVYNWSSGAGNASTIYNLGKGTYTVTVTDSHGCKDTSSTIIDTIGQTAVIKPGQKNVSCFGGNNGSATLIVSGGDTALYAYQWSPTGGFNATGAGLTAGIYTITVTYIANGCRVIINDTITQPTKLNSSITDSAGCSNVVKATDNTSGGVGPYNYLWMPSGDTTSTALLPSGNYTLTVTDANNCTDVVPFIAPQTSPIAAFIAVPDTATAGDSIKFVNLSSGVISWYWWTFGDQGNSSDTNPYHTYNYGGTYPVYLYVGNSIGCKDSVLENVYIKAGVTAGNVFTPNGDGINDVFHVNAVGLTNYKIDIYDRWGLLIFEGVGPDNDWTGRTMAGEEVPTGTYYYVITASDAKGKPYNTKGFVTLIR